MKKAVITIQLPDWMHQIDTAYSQPYSSRESKMKLAIRLAQQNVQFQTGGPFGAAVFEQDSGYLIAMGVNLVCNQHCSLAHAEMVALAQAQQRLRTHSLAPKHTGHRYQLVTSVAPCAMCLGAIPWSGVRSLICGARGEDAEGIGFDEGAKPDAWIGGLQGRGIEVFTDVLRDQALHVLQDYRTRGGELY